MKTTMTRPKMKTDETMESSTSSAADMHDTPCSVDTTSAEASVNMNSDDTWSVDTASVIAPVVDTDSTFVNASVDESIMYYRVE